MRRRPVLCLLSGLIVVVASGCLSRPINPVEPTDTTTFTQTVPTSIDKIDLLLAIDNSSSMADKQAILADAVPKLVGGLLNPNCVDDAGNPVDPSQQPSDPFANCPPKTAREFPAVADVHVGIVTSSLGGLGVCDPKTNAGHVDDQGHLISRVKSGDAAVPTYQNLGFLDWDPKNPTATPDESVLPQFESDLRELVERRRAGRLRLRGATRELVSVPRRARVGRRGARDGAEEFLEARLARHHRDAHRRERLQRQSG